MKQSSHPTRIAVLSTGRQDFGILRSTLLILRDAPDFELRLWIGGMHLSDRFGGSGSDVVAAGLDVSVEMDFVHEPPDAPADAARAIEAATDAIRHKRPEALVLVGDRHETLAVAVAATLERVPIVHLHGGEETEGAVDNAFRHALTKLSHLHLVSSDLHADRVIQMGEDPRTVRVVGAAGLDNAHRSDLPNRAELGSRLKISLNDPIVLVTVHPTTLSEQSITKEAEAITQAIENVQATYIVSLPNADAGGTEISSVLRQWARNRANVAVVPALGDRNYWGLLLIASAVLGNSSSGIIEAPAVGVPAVNVGDRQRGRTQPALVVNAKPDARAVELALNNALDPSFSARREASTYLRSDSSAAERIIGALRDWEIPVPPRKTFRGTHE